MPRIAGEVDDATVGNQIGDTFLAIAADQCRMQSFQTVAQQHFTTAAEKASKPAFLTNPDTPAACSQI